MRALRYACPRCGRAGGRAIRARGRPGRRDRVRSRQPAASRVRRERQSLRGRGRPRRHATSASTAGEGSACMGTTGAVTKIDKHGRKSRSPPALPRTPTIPGNGRDRSARHRGPAARHRPRDQRRSDRSAVQQHADRPREASPREQRYANLFGRVLAIAPHLPPVSVADTWAFERDANPDGAAVDANPVDVEVDGLRLIVPDAGGNALNTFTLGRGSEPGRLPDPRGRSVAVPWHGGHAGGADVGRGRPGSAILRQPAHRLPVPDRRSAHLPRQPTRRDADRGVPRLHRDHGPGVR